GFVLGPILGRLAIPARVELTTRLMPKLLLIMPTLVTCTLASGWQLGRNLGTIDSGYVNHGWIVASYVVVGVMAVIALVLLARAPGFNRDAFFDVAKWALLAYAVIAAILEFVFVNDGTRGGVLVVLTLSLIVYAVHVPLLIGFTVARYQ